MSPDVHGARRNASVLGATGLTVGLLFLFPTSTNRTTHIALHSAVPAGVVGGTAAPAPAGKSPAAATAVRTVNGASVDTPYGPVQVQIKIRAGRIVSAKAIVYPLGSSTDQQINSYAIPALQQETIAAQSGQIDTISGATYTSQGYAGSLQSALDAAHF